VSGGGCGVWRVAVATPLHFGCAATPHGQSGVATHRHTPHATTVLEQKKGLIC